MAAENYDDWRERMQLLQDRAARQEIFRSAQNLEPSGEPGVPRIFTDSETFRALSPDEKSDQLAKISPTFRKLRPAARRQFIDEQDWGLSQESEPEPGWRRSLRGFQGRLEAGAAGVQANVLGPMAGALGQGLAAGRGLIQSIREGEFDEPPESLDIGIAKLPMTYDPAKSIVPDSPARAAAVTLFNAKQLFDVASKKMGLSDSDALRWVENTLGAGADALEGFHHRHDPSVPVPESDRALEARRQLILESGGGPRRSTRVTLQEASPAQRVWMIDEDGERRLDPRFPPKPATPRIEADLPWDRIYYPNPMEMPGGVGPLVRGIYETVGIVPQLSGASRMLGAIPKIGSVARHLTLPAFAYLAARGREEPEDIQQAAAAGGAGLALGLQGIGYLPSPFLRAAAGALLFGGQPLLSAAQGEMPWSEGTASAIIGAWFGGRTPYNPRMRFTPEQLEVKRRKLMALGQFEPIGRSASPVAMARQRDELVTFLDGEDFTPRERAEILKAFDDNQRKPVDDPNWAVNLSYAQRSFPLAEPEPLALPPGPIPARLAAGERPTEPPAIELPAPRHSYDWWLAQAQEQGFSGEAAHVFARAQTRGKIHPQAVKWLDGKHSEPRQKLADYLERLGDGWVHVDQLARVAYGDATAGSIRRVGTAVENLWRKGVLEFQMMGNGWGAFRLRRADSEPAPGQEPVRPPKTRQKPEKPPEPAGQVPAAGERPPEAAPEPPPREPTKTGRAAYKPAGPPSVPEGEMPQLAKRPDGSDPRAAWGEEHSFEMADGGRIRARYVLMEEGDSRPSHDPRLGYAQTPGYEPRKQTKDYATSFDFQSRVQENAGPKRKDNLVNSPSETGEHGPPQMDLDRDVIGGNGRAQSQRLQSDETLQAEARRALETHPQFGIKPEALKDFQRPVLRRVLLERIPQNEQEAAALSHDLNRNFTARASGEAEGAGLAARLSDRTMGLIDGAIEAGGENVTFRDILTGNRELVASLMRDKIILPQEVQHYTSDGVLNSAGKDLVERVLLAKISSDPVLRDKINADLRGRLLRMGPGLLRAKRFGGPEVDDLLNQAIASEVGRFHSKQNVGDFINVLAAEGMDAYPSQKDPRVAALHRILAPKQYGGVTPTEAKRRIARFGERLSEMASGQRRMFGEDVTLDSALRELLEPSSRDMESTEETLDALGSDPEVGETVMVNVGTYKQEKLKEGTVLKVWTDKNKIRKVQLKLPKEGTADQFYKRTFRVEDIRRRPPDEGESPPTSLMSEMVEAEVDAAREVEKLREGDTSSIFHGSASVREARATLGRGWNWKAHVDFPLEAPGLKVPKRSRKKGDILQRLARALKVPIQQGALPHIPPERRSKRPHMETRPVDPTVTGVHGYQRIWDPAAVTRGGKNLGDIHIAHWGDIQVAAHEIAHALDTKFPTFRELFNFSDAEMHRMAMGADPEKFAIFKELLGVSYEVTQPHEGFAEFMRLWFTAKDAARSRAPNAYAAIEERIRALPKPISKALFRAQREMHDYFGQNAGQAIDNMYGDPGGNPGQIMNGHAARLREILVDDLQGILSLEREIRGNYTSDGAYEFSRLLRGASESAEGMMNHGAPVWLKDASGRNTWQTSYSGPGLADILEPVARRRSTMQKFWRYADARMAKEMEEQVRNKDFTPNMIEQGMSYESLPHFRETFDKLVEFNAKVADYGREAGLWNTEQQARWRRHEYAMGLFRQMAASPEMRGTGAGALVGDVGVYTARGSTRQLKRPMERLMEGPSRILHMARENVAKRKIIELLESPGGGAFGARVPERSERIQVGLRQIAEAIAREFREFGIRLPRDFLEQLGNVDRITLYLGGRQPFETRGTGNRIMRYFDKGKPVYYELYDPLLIRSIQSFRRIGQTGIMYWLDAFRRFRQAAVTSTIDFMVRNAVRDPLLSSITTRTGHQHFTAALRGYWSAASQDPYFIESLANGGGGDLLRRSGPADWERHIRKRAQRENHDLRGYLFSPRDVWRAFTRVGRVIEQGPRMGEFIRARQQGMTSTHASFLRRNISTDFAMQGEAMTGPGKMARIFMNTTPFANAMAVGADKLWQNVARDPTDRARTGIRMGLFSLAVLGLHLWNRENPDYAGMADWDKRANIHLYVDGDHYRIPTIWEAGMVANVTRNLYELFANSPDIEDRSVAESVRAYGKHFMGFMKDTAQTVQENFRVGLPLGVGELAWMYATNKDWFTGTPIVPLGLENAHPAQQIRHRQSRTMHELGRMMEERDIRVSPAKAEAFMRFLFSTWTSYGMMLSDRYVYPHGPSMHPDDRPILRNFTERPRKYPKAEQQYYDLLSEVETEYNRFLNLQKQAQNPFNRGEDARYFNRRMGQLLKEGVVTSGRQWDAVNQQVRQLNRRIADLRRGTARTPHERDVLRDKGEQLRLERLRIMERQLQHGFLPKGVERPE